MFSFSVSPAVVPVFHGHLWLGGTTLNSTEQNLPILTVLLDSFALKKKNE